MVQTHRLRVTVSRHSADIRGAGGVLPNRLVPAKSLHRSIADGMIALAPILQLFDARVCQLCGDLPALREVAYEFLPHREEAGVAVAGDGGVHPPDSVVSRSGGASGGHAVSRRANGDPGPESGVSGHPVRREQHLAGDGLHAHLDAQQPR